MLETFFPSSWGTIQFLSVDGLLKDLEWGYTCLQKVFFDIAAMAPLLFEHRFFILGRFRSSRA